MCWTGKEGSKEWKEVKERKGGKRNLRKGPSEQVQRWETVGHAQAKLAKGGGYNCLEKWRPCGNGGFELGTRMTRHLNAN